ncbi:hypothetical protein ARSEF4850_003030 [Beauveria asiatica]
MRVLESKSTCGVWQRAAIGELLAIPIVDDAAFDSRAEEHQARCHPNTRIDLLRQIMAWAEASLGEGIFWLNGAAGTGKSTISRTVARQFNDRGILGASFFFKRGESDRGHAAHFFTTIAAQLVAKVPELLPLVKDAIDSVPDIASKSLSDQFQKLILQPLSQINPQGGSTIVLVVDALDECDNTNDIKLIIHLFSKTTDLRFIRLRVFIASTPELSIRLGFKDIQDKHQQLVLQKIPESTTKGDIETFLCSEFASIRTTYNTQVYDMQQLALDWPGENTMKKLAHMSAPLFTEAATICRFVGDQSILDPNGQLEHLLHSQTGSVTAHDTFDAMYLTVLGQLVVEKTSVATSLVLKDFEAIVGAIVLLAEPLSASSLSHLLSIPMGSITRTLTHLHAVLDVPPEATSPIKPWHMSFREFLTDPAKRDVNQFWVDERRRHYEIATKCITCLGLYLKKDICNLGMPGKSRREVNAKNFDESLPAHMRYACKYWVSHMAQSNERIQDGDVIHQFLRRHFLHWLEALSLMGIISESITMIQTLRSLVNVSDRPPLHASLVY